MNYAKICEIVAGLVEPFPYLRGIERYDGSLGPMSPTMKEDLYRLTRQERDYYKKKYFEIKEAVFEKEVS